PNPRQELPVLEFVLRHLVDIEKHGSGDGEVDTEADTGGNDRPQECLGEPVPPGRATSRSSITTITGLDSIPPYAPAIPDRTFTWESSSPSALRLAIHVAAPPPMDPSAFSGPRLAPPMS